MTDFSPQAQLRLNRLAAAFLAAMEAEPLADFTQAVEALSLIAAMRSGGARIGTVEEQSWSNASGHLFDLAQCGRLYRDQRTGAAVV